MSPLLFLETLGRWLCFAWRVLLCLPLAMIRLQSWLPQFYRLFMGVLPLALAAGLALGVVVWLHLHGVLGRLGPGYQQLLPQAMALAVVLELGPVSAGFIVAGRSGAGLAAELSSMKLTEQIDALRMLGLEPLRTLVAPRVLACMAALPLITVFIDYLALAGGCCAEMFSGGMYFLEYRNACLSQLRLEDVVPATLKTVVFGWGIGVLSCFFGMRADGGAEGIGVAATRGVIWSLLWVMVANVFLVKLLQVASLRLV